jgi:hypothetical protein
MTNGVRPVPGYLAEDDCRLADLIEVVSEKTDLADYPHASTVEQNVLMYDSARLREDVASAEGRRDAQAELARALHDGPGIVVFTGAFGDLSVVDRATEQFEAIITGQRAAGGAAGDHFAESGQNDRIWNALEKLALRAPDVFAAYYANDVVATVCHAWLGPGYQVTSQVNVVNLAARPRPCTATITWASSRARRPRGSRPTCTGCRPRSPCRARSRTRTCRSRPARRCTCRTPRSTCPATWPAGAVAAFAERKFGPGGPFNPQTPGAWTDSPRVRGSAQIHDEAFKACVAVQAQYVFDTFGKFPGTVPSVFIMNYVQVHHLDLEFYDRFFRQGAYLRTHAEHMQRWHGWPQER